MVGWQWIDEGTDYTYWNAGLTLGFMENWSADIRYWDTDLSNGDCGGPQLRRAGCGNHFGLVLGLNNFPKSTSHLKRAPFRRPFFGAGCPSWRILHIRPIGAADPDAIARAHAVYTPLALVFYDVVVHGLSNRFAWRCPTERLLGLYAANLSANHLEAGAGTGLFLDRAGANFDRLVLLDINEHCLKRAGRRLARFKPTLRQANLLAPLDPPGIDALRFGRPHLCAALPAGRHGREAHGPRSSAAGDGGGGGAVRGHHSWPWRAGRTARRGPCSTSITPRACSITGEDDLETLSDGLRQRFATVEIDTQGCVALFRAR